MHLRPLFVATVVAVATTGVAYLFGPDAKADPQKRKDSPAAARAVSATTATTSPRCPADADFPKRQLRGVWIATVRNIDWPSKTGLSPDRQRAEYVRILDQAVSRRLNAVFVQVRPAGDAFYKSDLEPWSEFLTGKPDGDPGWDPLPFLISEAHKRGLEFHAWFNPYRAANDANTSRLPANHPARQHPEWVVKYEGRIYYNPGLPEVRDHVTKVIKDVVQRYDVDGIHFDDYFYPYPSGGAKFNDAAAYKKYGKGKSLADWRRDNVNTLVAQVDKTVHETKNQVKFGISPFGIWRNKAQDPTGSDTNGMSAYDAIYADARAWIKTGTVDYILPQLYWSSSHRTASYSTLLPWWAREVRGTGVQLYIGQALYRVGTKDEPAWTKPGELPAHLALNRKYPEVKGDVYFSAKQLSTNPLKVLDRIVADYYRRPALLPLMKERGGKAPAPVTGLQAANSTLRWRSSPGAAAYAVYRVAGKGDDCATATARNLLAVVPATGAAEQSYALRGNGTYYVTSLDRLQHESAPAHVTVGG
ncbi:family 10 glycosylhydrolase [Thermopolyspora sp. NPDC052614]|uniref:glycoside hydrolase family 10 protein n=1 Tax=Thermopolyspora sp. NPDC052614 TaxID=3155682 RepID=UPI0034498EFB